jgi:broad specificity phosphatase PhoE
LKNELPIVYLARHGETAWTLSGQHTGLTDLPLTEHGERTARRLGERLRGGETPQQVSARADGIVNRVRLIPGDVLVFTSGHFMRVLASRWLGLEPTANSRYFMLSTASLSALGYENELSRPVIRFWNDTRHVDEPEVATHASP